MSVRFALPAAAVFVALAATPAGAQPRAVVDTAKAACRAEARQHPQHFDNLVRVIDCQRATARRAQAQITAKAGPVRTADAAARAKAAR